ncbi:TRAP transporter small permease [Caldovatus sp. SYSU G05006]|uniref:TRAP transporter small permease protein n=2 Tax=Caldovatus aquaticus TaxID=2865671 RepID=A0ABS7F3M8_9PROT|nr:TRAP transporter small permease [Caldovatus aquaticus]
MTSQPAARRGLLRRAAAAWSRLLSALLAISVAILVLPVSLQIFSRYTHLIPHYIWTEEMARFLLVWMIMIGAMVAVREGSHFTVDLWPPLPPRPAALLELLSGLGVLALAVVFLWWGWEFTAFAFHRISELAELPLWLIHVAWPITGLTWLLFQGERMADALHTLRTGEPRPLEHHEVSAA